VAYLTARLEKIVLSEKMIEDLSQVEESAMKSTYRLGVGFERCEDKGEKSTPKFIPSSTYHQEVKTIKSIKAQYPFNPKSSFNPKREVKREPPSSRERKLLFACFVDVLATWMSFTSDVRELRRDALNMLQTHIVMSSLIFRLVLLLVFRLVLILMLRLTLLLMLCLNSLMDLTIVHMVLVHERNALCLDALDTTHILIVVIVSYEGLIFLLEGLTLILS
jgi:hypothetical protein